MREYFAAYVATGIEPELLDPELGRFDLPRIAAALKPERDLQFQFLGLQTLYDRYLLQTRGVRFELPQAFFMRVAMGLAMREIDREAQGDRVLRPALVLRFHVLDADAVQCGHAAAAAFVLFPDHGVRRPRRHLQGDQGQCVARQVFGRPR